MHLTQLLKELQRICGNPTLMSTAGRKWEGLYKRVKVQAKLDAYHSRSLKKALEIIPDEG